MDVDETCRPCDSPYPVGEEVVLGLSERVVSAAAAARLPDSPVLLYIPTVQRRLAQQELGTPLVGFFQRIRCGGRRVD